MPEAPSHVRQKLVHGTPDVRALARMPGARLLDREALKFAVVRAYHGFIEDRGLDSAAALSFFGALSLFPASLAVVSGFALLDDKTRAPADILRIVDTIAPHETVLTLHGPIEQLLSIPNAGYGFLVGLALTVWTLSGYITAFGRAINTAYGVREGRRWVPLRATMIGVAIGLAVIGAAIVLILAGTPTVAEAVAKAAHLPTWLVILWDYAKWPVLAALAIVVVAILYYYSPNVRHLRVRWVTLGALLAIVVWVCATIGFGIYVLNFSHYNLVYGWLGGAVVLLLWLYLSNLVVVFGAEMDAEIVRVRQLVVGNDADEQIQLPVRSTRRIATLDRWARDDARNGRTLLEREDRKRGSEQKPGSERAP
jgi:membrane protein